MLEEEGTFTPAKRDEGHSRWLAMQSAYAEYMQASEALDCTHESPEGLTAAERLRIMIAEGRHRVAFERYLEARMAFLETHIDEIKQADGGPGDAPLNGGDCSKPSWWSLANCRPFLEALAVVLLCTSAFSLVRVQKKMRNVETSREEFQTTLTQISDGLQALRQQVDALGPLQYSPTQHIVNASSGVKPLRRAPARISSRKPSINSRWKHQPTNVAQKHAYDNLYSSTSAQTQRASPGLTSPLFSPRQIINQRPRDAWGMPIGANSGDARF